MATPNPMATLPPPPVISSQTMHMAGLEVDVYGLSELPQSTTAVSVLWLHHPRLRAKADMADIAARCIAAARTGVSGRGLIAVAFDQRNHGSRIVRAAANEAWRGENKTHAQDVNAWSQMFGIVAGTVADTSVLMDALPGYVFPDGRVQIVQHVMLGVSLGGHSGWQLMFAEPRVTAAVLVVGCPDFMFLMSDRARLSKLSTFTAEDNGASFLGSRDFPVGLVDACNRLDPKGIVFGTAAAAWPASEADQQKIRQTLQATVAGKAFLICSGADDKLVPYRCAEPFLNFFKRAAAEWSDLGFSVEDNVYPGTGHVFSAEMVRDAVRFIVDAVAADTKKSPSPADDRSSKI